VQARCVEVANAAPNGTRHNGDIDSSAPETQANNGGGPVGVDRRDSFAAVAEAVLRLIRPLGKRVLCTDITQPAVTPHVSKTVVPARWRGANFRRMLVEFGSPKNVRRDPC